MIPPFDPRVNFIHLDMDGVLADFDKFVLDNMGRTFPHQEGPSDREMWDFLASIPNLYYKLPLTSYAIELYEIAKSITPNVKVLTAIPRRTTMPTAEQDKREWIATYVDTQLPVFIGPYSRDKWKHCKPGDILIDDRPDNIQAWVEQGHGHGILHITNDLQDTLHKLSFVPRVMYN